MNNINFINSYGKREFYDMCDYIQRDLYIAKAQKQIGGFKISNRKKRVLFYRKNKESVILDFATIYSVGIPKLQKYLENM